MVRAEHSITFDSIDSIGQALSIPRYLRRPYFRRLCALFVPPLVSQLSSKWINDSLYLILTKTQGFYYGSNTLILLFITGGSKNSTKMSWQALDKPELSVVALLSSAIAAVEVGQVGFSFPLSLSCHHHYHSSRSLSRTSCLRKNPFSRG